MISHILISVNFCAAHCHQHTGNCTLPCNGQSVYFYATQYYFTAHTDDTKNWTQYTQCPSTLMHHWPTFITIYPTEIH